MSWDNMVERRGEVFSYGIWDVWAGTHTDARGTVHGHAKLRLKGRSEYPALFHRYPVTTPDDRAHFREILTEDGKKFIKK